jgi:formylglycine-generating enzyme required for sulfatase activity
MFEDILIKFAIATLFLCMTAGTAFPEVSRPVPVLPVIEGCYFMGNTFGDAYYAEMPVHEVCISRFSISPFPVTRGEFNAFVHATNYLTDAEKGYVCHVYNGDSWAKISSANWRTPGFPQTDDHPVVCVSWNDATAYTQWMSRTRGQKYRLPTEAEWEYAARSGGRQERYAGGDVIEKVAWYAGNSEDRTHPVGQKQPNGLGLYDMSGNVWQWTADWYDSRYYRESPRTDPGGPETGKKRVFRGGSWYYDQRGARTSYRDSAPPDFCSSYLGFRLASSTP